MQHLKRSCLNPKVIAGLAAGAVGVWAFKPEAFAVALPLLVLAICPLSMIGMVFLMRGSAQGAASGGAASCSTADPQEQAQASPAGAERPSVEALRAQVAELEARLAAEAGPTEAAAGVSAVRDGE